MSAPLAQFGLSLGWGSGREHSVGAGFAGLGAGMFLGIRAQRGLVAGAEDWGFVVKGFYEKNKKIPPFVKSSGVKVLAVTKVLGRWRCAHSITGVFILSLLRALWAATSLLLGVRQHLFRGRSGFQKYLGRN